MDLLKAQIETEEANFIDEYRLLSIDDVALELWDLTDATVANLVLFQLPTSFGPGWVILRNYELDGTKHFRASAKSGIVGIFLKGIVSKGFVIPVGTLLNWHRSDPEAGVVKWEDWKKSMTYLNLPRPYELYVFHNHVLCLHRSQFLRYYIFDFTPPTARLNAAARGALPSDRVELSGRAVTFSGEIRDLEGEYFPTENGILAIKVSPIVIVTNRTRLLT